MLWMSCQSTKLDLMHALACIHVMQCYVFPGPDLRHTSGTRSLGKALHLEICTGKARTFRSFINKTIQKIFKAV